MTAQQQSITSRILKTEDVEWRKLLWLQSPNLKEMSKDAFQRLKNSLLLHSFVMPFHVSEINGTILILDGHHRQKAMNELEAEGVAIPAKLPANFILCADRKAALELVLVYSSIYANITEDSLYEMIHKEGLDWDRIMPTLEMPTFEIAAFNEGWMKPDPGNPITAPPQTNRAAELNQNWKVAYGDVWKIGRHRLICGNSTDNADVFKLMAGDKASLCITSPPYNVAANSSLPNHDKYLVKTDEVSSADYLKLLNDFLSVAMNVCEFVWVNAQSVSGNKVALIEFLHTNRDTYSDTIIWDKLTAEPAMARQVLNSRFEFVHGFSKRALRVVGTKDFHGTLENVLPMNSRQDKDNSDVHKATFPAEFAAHFIGNFCNESEIVYEPFCGTGTVIEVCEQLNRTARAVELDANYCAVILDRMQTNFPGIIIAKQ